MGVDIYFVSGKKEFSCRLYWITNLIDEYGWQYKKNVPELILGKGLNENETEELYTFLEFALLRLKNDKQKTLSKFDTNYFKKTEEICKSLQQLIALLRKTQIDKQLFPKLQGLLRRFKSFIDAYGEDPTIKKKEVVEEFNEKISLVEKIVKRKGVVSIG